MTNKYRVGMTVKYLNSKNTKKILEVLDNTVLLSEMDNYDNCGSWYSFRELDQFYTIEKEDWRPEEDEQYYFIDADGEVDWTNLYEKSPQDQYRLATKNFFSSEAEAEQRLSEIKKEYGIK